MWTWVINFIGALREKWGTKFIITAIGTIMIGYLIELDKVPGLYGGIMITTMVISYHYARIKQETHKHHITPDSGTTNADTPDSYTKKPFSPVISIPNKAARGPVADTGATD